MERDQVYLLDILTSARLALSYVTGVSEKVFLKDTQRQDSVVRRIEIIGEAARRVSPETKAALPAIPWSDMIGMRNLMIHDYDDVDLQIVWETLQRDLPDLITKLEVILLQEDS